jgi:molybdopterin molybdotransferase
VRVRRRPRVAILVTGDELVPPGTPLAAGQIHDANSFGLAAAVQETGAEPRRLPPVPDEESVLAEALAAAAPDCDVVVVSGGVSVGRRDYVRPALEAIGRLDFWRIAVQPGKPLAFGRIGTRPVFGLPGNPVSALITLELFVRPLLRRLLGLAGDGRRHVSATLTEAVDKDPQRRAYLRVVMSRRGAQWKASPAGGQASSQLRAMGAADALLIVPEGVSRGVPGTSYETVMLRSDSEEDAG